MKLLRHIIDDKTEIDDKFECLCADIDQFLLTSVYLIEPQGDFV